MLVIEIKIPRPWTTLCTILGVIAITAWVSTSEEPVLAVGGEHEDAQMMIHENEEDVRQLRIEQAVIEQREEILRYQLNVLENERRKFGKHVNEEVEEQFRQRVQELVRLIKDKREGEQRLRESLEQLWAAQGKAREVSGRMPGQEIMLDWPVEPEYGISAIFGDIGYERVFGIPHKAIDIPALQGTTIFAAANGVVEEVSDNGMGFNSVTIRHDGFVTLYGHVESFLVKEGDKVRMGDPIAKSGGMPGTAGAGHLSTGPHLHFELLVEGTHIDPEPYLPRI